MEYPYGKTPIQKVIAFYFRKPNGIPGPGSRIFSMASNPF
jgi:hypothetical protein